MADMLTAKDVQELLQVDRSTVYRMAEAGRLPAIKVGKQWRFPAAQIDEWMATQMGAQVLPTAVMPPVAQPQSIPLPTNGIGSLAALLPLECVQLIQESHADLLGVMLIVTDMEGNPITQPSRPCGLFEAINKRPDAVQRCISSWNDLGQTLSFEPTFQLSHLGLLCTRGLIRVGTELKGMVVAGCIAPEDWPPAEEQVKEMAAEFGIAPTMLKPRLHEVFRLDEQQKTAVLTSVQQIANIVAHIVKERLELVGRLDAIAGLAHMK
jgi:excisionase family DNA binding protein